MGMRLQSAAFGLISLAWIIALPFTLVMAVTSPRLAEISHGPAADVLVANFASFPLACLLAPIAGWIARKKGQERLSWALVLSPLLWVVLPVVLWGLRAA